MRDVQNLHRHCAEFHIKVEINIAGQEKNEREEEKKYLKNTISRIFMELFLGISHCLLRLSALLFAFLCVDSSWIVQTGKNN